MTQPPFDLSDDEANRPRKKRRASNVTPAPPTEPDAMAHWIRFGAEAMKSMIVEENPITLASFARRVEKQASEAKLSPGEMTVRWVWQALLAHPVLSEQLRRHFAEALHDKRDELTVLPIKSLLAIELTPASGRLREKIPNLPASQWALFELLEPLKFIRGNRGRLRCDDSACRVALRPRPKPPPAGTVPNMMLDWAQKFDPIVVQECGSLNHAAQVASVAIEHLRRGHTHNVFTEAVWLPDDENTVYLDDLRDRIEYDGHTSTDAYIKASRADIQLTDVDPLLQALGRSRPITTLKELLAIPSDQVTKGMFVRNRNSVEGEVLGRNPDGTLRMRLQSPDGYGREDGDMDVWLFDEVRRSDELWGFIKLTPHEQQRRKMLEAATRRR